MLFLLYEFLYSNMIFCKWDEMGCISIQFDLKDIFEYFVLVLSQY